MGKFFNNHPFIGMLIISDVIGLIKFVINAVTGNSDKNRNEDVDFNVQLENDK